MLRAKTDGIVPTPIRRGTPPGGDGAVWRQRWGHGAANDVIATKGTQRARARVVLLLFSPESSWGGGEGSFRRVGGGWGAGCLGRVRIAEPYRRSDASDLVSIINPYRDLADRTVPNVLFFPIQICRFQTSASRRYDISVFIFAPALAPKEFYEVR